MIAQSDIGQLRRVLVKHPREAFRNPATIAREWEALHFTSAPDFDRAVAEYDRFLELLGESSCEIVTLPQSDGVGLDSIYVRDATIICDRGAILCRMGKALRTNEPASQEIALRETGLDILGRIEEPGCLEGGDVFWLDERTLAVGRGYRTNDAGLAQLRALLGDSVDQVITVPLPHWHGPNDVFHLMSMISPVDRDLAVVYSPLLPVPFRENLLARGITLVEVPEEEFETMGANVLALGPRHCLMVRGNPVTRARLEKAGAQVREYNGNEISLKGGGGPTCLTRPLARL